VKPTPSEPKPTPPEAKPTQGAPAPGTIQARAGDGDPQPLLPTMMPETAGLAPAHTPPPMPQDWRYDVRIEIARGGMGRVVEAIDSVLGRTVALKEALSLDPDALRRFQRETRITARLEHPAIVPVHDAGITPSGAPFYVMRKVEGRALEDLVARANDLPKRLALVPYVVTSAQAVAHAHSRGIVHRDIKPSNILVGERGETILIDWGLAKAIGEAEDPTGPVSRVLEDEEDTVKTRAGIVYGTPGFMAPEQLRGKPVDEQCDVYALGATLYHVLARRPPHHHKNGDVMMRAAVEGPPQPLVEVVPGIPPELAAIVDKALAHDKARRYQNAGALAEDLQAFLTGRLVAAHNYTARERFWRFIRQNRTSVGAGLVAFIVIVAAIVIAFVRIQGERDRADEQARIATERKKVAEQQREEIARKARELTLSNARAVSQTEPTRAVAMVKPLVTPDMWQQARDVGAAARASGIAYSLPISKHTASLELSRDGGHALVAGDDGIVRVVDLAHRTSKEIFNAGGTVRARFADGERRIILYQGNRLWILDAQTGAKREVTAPTAIASLETSGPLAYWIDTQQAAWKLDLEGGTPAPVELAEPVTILMPSPDGRWLAFGGTKHLLLADRSRPTLPAEIITEGLTHHMTWSADSRRLAVQIDDEVIDVNTQPAPQIFARFLVGARFGLAYSGGKIFSSGPNGVSQLARPESHVRLPDPGHTLGVHEGRDRVVISAKPQGELVVLSEYGDHTLKAPVPIQLVATSTRGPWVTAAAENMLLVWSLDGFEPRSYDASPPTSARFVTGDSMIVTYFDDSADWIDLRTHKETSLGLLPSIQTVVASPDGAEAIAVDATRRAWHVAGVGQPKAIGDEISYASFLDDSRYVVAGEGGVRLNDQRTNREQALFAHEPEARALVTVPSGGGWVAAAFADGLVWRRQLSTSSDSSLSIVPAPAMLPVVLAGDGTAYLGVGGELRAWRIDGRVDVLASGFKQIVNLAIVEPDVVFVLCEDSTGHLVDVRGKTVTAHLPVAASASVAANGALIANPTVSGGVELIDPGAGWRWPLAAPKKGMQHPFSYAEISPDGRRVLGVTEDAVVVWTLDLPGTADETSSWLDKLTNATVDNPSDPLRWR
jgi:hypothetical protein